MSIKKIAAELGRIEHNYLSSPKSSDQKLMKGCVQHIIETLILPTLNGSVGVSSVIHAGSQYEYTALPESSDFDLQFCLNLSHCYPKPTAIPCDWEGWIIVEGGPTHLQDDKGDLASSKVRDKVQSDLTRAINTYSESYNGGQIRITRADGWGPAAILNVQWKGLRFNIDVVGCIKGSDVQGLSGRINLIAKKAGDRPRELSPSRPGDRSCWTSSIWKATNSELETNAMKKLNDGGPAQRRKLTLLKIMKVMKKYNSQLAQFGSYFYKNILFYMDEEYQDSGYWDNQDKLAQRFTDMMDMILEAVESQELLVFYDEKTNLLKYQSEFSDLQNTANYLRKLQRSGNYIELLKRV